MGVFSYALLMNPEDIYGPGAPQVVHDLMWSTWGDYRCDAQNEIAQAYHRMPRS